MEQIVYASYHKDADEVEKSSSGAMFTAFSDFILNNNGLVVSAAYDYSEHKLKHIICQNKEERDLCRGSKYIQSYINKDIYKEVEQALNNRKMVLYMGMPCQIAAVKNYLKIKNIDSEYLYTCDILCHGVGSPGIWDSFINYLEKSKKTKIKFLTFKDKRNGWKNPICIARDEKKEYSLRKYSWLYFSNAIMRPSCYSCKYTTTNREGDITIGDFWKIKSKYPEMYNSRGTSFAIVNTEQGKRLFNKIKSELVYKECKMEDCIQNNMNKPTEKGRYHNSIMNDYKKGKKVVFFKKWGLILFLERIKKKVIHK